VEIARLTQHDTESAKLEFLTLLGKPWGCSSRASEKGRRRSRLELTKVLVRFEGPKKEWVRKRPSSHSQILAAAPINPTEVVVC